MKKKTRYELLLDPKTGPKLVDVTKFGKGEGFDTPSALRNAVIMSMGSVSSDIDNLLNRWSTNNLKKDDVLSSRYREHPNDF